MIWVRKGFVHLFAIVLFVSLLGAAAATNFNRTLAEPDQVKKLLVESGAYDHAVSAALEKSQEDALKEENDSSISLSHTVVQQAAKKAFNPEFLEENANTFIDANYDWLAGKTATPEFSLDFTGAKQDFAQLVGEYTTNRLKELPACTEQQTAQLQLPVDPMEVECRPAGIDPQAEGVRVTQEINKSNFLSKPVISSNSFGRDENSTSKPYYQRFARAPKAYQLSQKLPWIFGLAALISALLILAIAPTRRKGWRRVGVMLALAGVLLIVSSLIGNTLANNVESKLDDSVSSQLEQPRSDFLDTLVSQLGQINLIFGIVFLVMAIAIFIKLYSGRDGKPRPAQMSKVTTVPRPATPAPSPTPQASPRRPGGMDIVGPPKPPRPTGPQPRPPGKPASGSPQQMPQLKKPPHKRPRLIQ